MTDDDREMDILCNSIYSYTLCQAYYRDGNIQTRCYWCAFWMFCAKQLLFIWMVSLLKNMLNSLAKSFFRYSN